MNTLMCLKDIKYVKDICISEEIEVNDFLRKTIPYLSLPCTQRGRILAVSMLQARATLAGRTVRRGGEKEEYRNSKTFGC